MSLSLKRISIKTRFGAILGGLAVAGLIAAFSFLHSQDGAACSGHNSHSGAASTAPLVKVTSKKDGDTTRFFVQNNEYCEVTVTFEVSSKNLKSAVSFPYTKSFPARQVTEAFALEPEDANEKWEYNYTNHYKLGNNLARHDDAVQYALPYSPGARFKVTQAYGGSYSHKGSNKYAIDWKMPEGTPVHAARGGEVVKIKDDSIKGGPSMNFDKYNNFVLIRHSDGTLGHYCHLLKDSIAVEVGDHISTGQMIARSGNTGFSSGPHLHFCVFRTLSGKERESVPVKFRIDGDTAATLIAGRNYRAAEQEPQRVVGGAGTVITAAGAGGS